MGHKTFEYKALDSKGKVKKGSLVAPHAEGAFLYLKEQGLHTLNLQPVGQGLGGMFDRLLQKRLSQPELLMMVTQLNTLLQAHIPLTEALNTLREIYASHFLGATLEKIEGDVMRGETLSAALRDQPRYFDSIFVTTIAHGEDNNRLTEALSHYQTYLSQKITLRAQVRKAFAYPIFLTLAFTLLAIFLSTYLLPPMVTFMAQNNPSDGEPLVWLLVVEFLESYGFITLGAMTFLIFAIYLLSKVFDALGQKLAKWRLKLPFVGEIMILENLRLFIQGLELLCRDGHDLPESLRMAQNMIQCPYLKRRMGGLGSKIDQGTSLYQSLRGYEFMPPVVLRMIKVGEQTGQLPWAFGQIGQYLNQTLLDKINRMGRILEPMLLLMMGGFLLTLVLGIFMPLYSHLGDFQ